MSATRVLQVCDTYDPTPTNPEGTAARALAAEGFDVTAAYLRGAPDPAAAEQLHCATEFFDFDRHQRDGRSLGALWRMARFLRRNRFDVLIANRFRPCRILARTTTLVPVQRRIAIIHGLRQFHDRRRKFFATTFLRSWNLVGVCRAVEDDLLASGAFSRERLRTIYNAIDVERVCREQRSRSDARTALGLPLGGFLFGTVGRMAPSKGHAHLIGAFGRIAQRVPDARLVIVGAGRLESQARQLARRLGVAGRVVFTGRIGEAYRWVRAFDVFVLPSLSEAASVALLEAMAARLPVVATRVGGNPELLGEHAPLVEPGDDEALAEALLAVHEMPPQRRAELGESLHRRAVDHYDLAAYRTAYRRLIS